MTYFNFGSGDDWASGTTGSDVMYGNAGRDYLFGGSGNDYIYGGSGNDYLHGGAGVDVVDGGSGNDTLNGGSGGDWIYTGSGYDTIQFFYGDTGTTWALSDTVMDYDPAADWVDSNIAGTWYNYVEYQIPYNAGFDQAAGYAMFAFGDGYWWGNPNTNHCFITDGVNGYLFSDLNDDNVMDSALELRGVTSLSQFNYTDII